MDWCVTGLNPGRRLNPTSSRFFQSGELTIPRQRASGAAPSLISGAPTHSRFHRLTAKTAACRAANRGSIPRGAAFHRSRSPRRATPLRGASGVAEWTCGFHVGGSDDPPTTRLRRCPPSATDDVTSFPAAELLTDVRADLSRGFSRAPRRALPVGCLF